MSAITRDLNDYGFSTELRVRLSETDAVGIVFSEALPSILMWAEWTTSRSWGCIISMVR